MRERRRWSTQSGYGHRERNDWNSGDLPSPFAEGDLLWLPEGAVVGDGRLRGLEGHGWYVVICGFSIDEGDAWYFRVVKGDDPDAGCSDRLHVGYASRSTWEDDVDYMAPFELVQSSDPTGLELRELRLETGWTFTPDPTLNAEAVVDVLGDLVDALSDSLSYEVSRNDDVKVQVRRALGLLPAPYQSYREAWWLK
jgi:hypothetical protein